MIFLTLTILNVFKKNQIVLKTQTIHHAYNLFFTDCPIYLQNTSTIETGIFDFQKLVVLVLKMLYEKPKITETIKLLLSNYLESKWKKS